MWKIIIATAFIIGAQDLIAQDPIPYPDIETEDSDKKVEVNVEGQGNQTSSGNEAGTTKGVVSISTGKTHFTGVGGLDVKFEGGSVSISGNPGLSNQSAAINCETDPNSCNEFIYEIMKGKLLPATPRSLGFHKTDSKPLKSKVSVQLTNDLVKKVKGKSGLWIRLKNGKWIRIDGNIELVKATINQLWRRGK